MKEFRDRLKEDNSVYKAHLVAEAARIWHWRANLSEEKIKIKEKKQYLESKNGDKREKWKMHV